MKGREIGRAPRACLRASVVVAVAGVLALRFAEPGVAGAWFARAELASVACGAASIVATDAAPTAESAARRLVARLRSEASEALRVCDATEAARADLALSAIRGGALQGASSPASGAEKGVSAENALVSAPISPVVVARGGVDGVAGDSVPVLVLREALLDLATGRSTSETARSARFAGPTEAREPDDIRAMRGGEAGEGRATVERHATRERDETVERHRTREGEGTADAPGTRNGDQSRDGAASRARMASRDETSSQDDAVSQDDTASRDNTPSRADTARRACIESEDRSDSRDGHPSQAARESTAFGPSCAEVRPPLAPRPTDDAVASRASERDEAARAGGTTRFGLRARWARETLALRRDLVVAQAILDELEAREALDDLRLPPDLAAELLRALPAPARHPGIDAALCSEVDRSVDRKVPSAARGDLVRACCIEFAGLVPEAEEWTSRWISTMLLARRACADPEGAALFEVACALALADAGWDPSEVMSGERVSADPRAASSGRARADPVVRAVRAAIEARCAGHALAELVVRAAPVERRRIESLSLDSEGRLRAGTRSVSIESARIDSWRSACGLVRTAIGWSGAALRSGPRKPRIRDAPFGVKPMARFAPAPATTAVVRAVAGSAWSSSRRAATLAAVARAEDTTSDLRADCDRYARQMRLAGFGPEGQRRLGRARVLVVGCGALGTVACEQLVRAGVGTVTIVDRDVVERSNLQRQTLFSERDAERRSPKAEAARSRLCALNGTVAVRAFVDDLHAGNALRYASEADILVDCLDNFESRYVLNDCAVMLGLPLVYGGAVGMRGMAAALLPVRGDAPGRGSERASRIAWSDGRATPCLRCLAPEPPPPGEVETCDAAGVLSSAAGVAASMQAGLAIRLIAEGAERVPANLVRFDLATLEFHHASILGARDAHCPCCAGRRFEFVDDPAQAGVRAKPQPARVLCGRGAVEVRLGRALDSHALERLSARLAEVGALVRERHDQTEVLRVALVATDGARNAPGVACEADRAAAQPGAARADPGGRPMALVVLAGVHETLAIVEGTDDPELARVVVARHVGV